MIDGSCWTCQWRRDTVRLFITLLISASVLDADKFELDCSSYVPVIQRQTGEGTRGMTDCGWSDPADLISVCTANSTSTLLSAAATATCISATGRQLFSIGKVTTHGHQWKAIMHKMRLKYTGMCLQHGQTTRLLNTLLSVRHHHHHHHHQLTLLEWPNCCKVHCTGRDEITGKRKCHSESSSFVVAAEQLRLERVLEHGQRRNWLLCAFVGVAWALHSIRPTSSFRSSPVSQRKQFCCRVFLLTIRQINVDAISS